MQAFTLIELSIVLVIIGLIVGGILVGRDLISAAAVRAQISQIEKYQAAVNAFKGKYGELPGDIPAAPAAQFGLASRGLYAGEGDGNGLLEGITVDSPSGYSCSAGFGGEQAMLWVDLSFAKLVDGSFTTATPTDVITGNSAITVPKGIDKYLPRAKIAGGGYIYVWCGGWTAQNGTGGDGKNYFAVTGVTGTRTGWFNNIADIPIFTVAQAYSVDSKIDDGLPQYGNVTAMEGAISYVNGYNVPWISGGPIDSTTYPLVRVERYVGDFDLDNLGPLTPSAVSMFYAAENGITVDQTCYNDYSGGSHTKVEHYSIEQNNGVGMSCSLSFKFQ